MILTELPQVRALPPHDKLQLIDELWLEVAREEERFAPGAEMRQVLKERWDRFLDNPSVGLDARDFTKRVKELRA